MSAPTAQPHLRRSLKLWDLVFYGIILIQPTAPMPLFGIVYNKAGGHVATTILLALVAMAFTALSYGRMARAYPSAGSAYTYVGKELHPALGYLTGWSMLLDYVLNPVICTIWCSKSMLQVTAALPYAFWLCFFATLFTGLNLRRIRATARTNEALAVIMLAVVAAFFAMTVRRLAGAPVNWLQPLYDPATFSAGGVLRGASLAVLTYIGFDGISTLSEEVENPRRNVLVGTVLACGIIGLLSALEVYAGQLVWPPGRQFRDPDTAFVEVAGAAGGLWLMHLVNLTLLVATIGSGTGALTGASRLLYGMGRDNAIPKKIFGYVSPATGIPCYNVLLLGAIVLAGAFVLTYELGAELLNFGAFVAFMGVNAAVIAHYWIRRRNRTWSYLVCPALGCLTCLLIWLNLGAVAKAAGAVWLGAGILYGGWKTKGFQEELVRFDIPED